MNQTTKITTASVRIMQSFNYSNFEVSMNLENADGINVADLDEARLQCQHLTNKAVKEYQENRQEDVKINSANEKKGLLKAMGNIQNEVSKVGSKDNATLDEVLNKPLYIKSDQPVIPAKKTPAKKMK